VEDLLPECGLDISHATVRYWWNRFGPLFAAKIQKMGSEPSRSFKLHWHLREVFDADQQ
jgi:putative transposase